MYQGIWQTPTIAKLCQLMNVLWANSCMTELNDKRMAELLISGNVSKHSLLHWLMNGWRMNRWMTKWNDELMTYQGICWSFQHCNQCCTDWWMHDEWITEWQNEMMNEWLNRCVKGYVEASSIANSIILVDE